MYEQRCREADETEQMAEKLSNTPTVTPKQMDKVGLQMFPFTPESLEVFNV